MGEEEGAGPWTGEKAVELRGALSGLSGEGGAAAQLDAVHTIHHLLRFRDTFDVKDVYGCYYRDLEDLPPQFHPWMGAGGQMYKVICALLRLLGDKETPGATKVRAMETLASFIGDQQPLHDWTREAFQDLLAEHCGLLEECLTTVSREELAELASKCLGLLGGAARRWDHCHCGQCHCHCDQCNAKCRRTTSPPQLVPVLVRLLRRAKAGDCKERDRRAVVEEVLEALFRPGVFQLEALLDCPQLWSFFREDSVLDCEVRQLAGFLGGLRWPSAGQEALAQAETLGRRLVVDGYVELLLRKARDDHYNIGRDVRLMSSLRRLLHERLPVAQPLSEAERSFRGRVLQAQGAGDLLHDHHGTERLSQQLQDALDLPRPASRLPALIHFPLTDDPPCRIS